MDVTQDILDRVVQLQKMKAQRWVTASRQTDKEVFEELCLLPAQVGKSTLTWTIQNFSKYKEETDFNSVSRSKSFTDDINHTKWSLNLELLRDDSTLDETLALVLVSCNERRVHTKVLLSISSVIEGKSVSNIFLKSFVMANDKYSWDLFRPDIFNSGYSSLHNDTLTVTCEIQAISEANLPKFKRPKRPLLQTYMRDNVPYDVTLCVGGEELPAHRLVLACHSPVFQAMFQHEMSEKASSRVDIRDFEPRVMKELLEFMYTGSTRNLEAMAPELLAASDKYGVEELKVLCEEQMLCQLNRKNVVETLELAELHNAAQLRARVLDFIAVNAYAIMDSVTWKQLVEQHPHIIAKQIEKSSSTE